MKSTGNFQTDLSMMPEGVIPHVPNPLLEDLVNTSFLLHEIKGILHEIQNGQRVLILINMTKQRSWNPFLVPKFTSD